jgi:chromosome partitioning protein
MFGVITLITPKGGTGKSTLARSLAAHRSLTGHKPALVDPDPQRTLPARYNPEGPMAAVRTVAGPEARVAEVIEELRARHRPVIVDTAGFRNRTAITALVATDLAIIPVKPAIEDVEAVVAAFGLVQSGKRHSAAVSDQLPDGNHKRAERGTPSRFGTARFFAEASTSCENEG